MTFRAARLCLAFIGATVASAGTYKMSWEDCGGASTHAHMQTLLPDTLTTGQHTTITGSGVLDEVVTSGTYRMQVKAAGLTILDHTGDICKPETITIRKYFVTIGSMNWKGFDCPVQKGTTGLGMGVYLEPTIPTWLGNPSIDVTGFDTSGNELLCVAIQMASQPKESIVV